MTLNLIGKIEYPLRIKSTKYIYPKHKQSECYNDTCNCFNYNVTAKDFDRIDILIAVQRIVSKKLDNAVISSLNIPIVKIDVVGYEIVEDKDILCLASIGIESEILNLSLSLYTSDNINKEEMSIFIQKDLVKKSILSLIGEEENHTLINDKYGNVYKLFLRRMD